MGNEDFFKWIDLGREKGWISQMYCSTHDILDEDLRLSEEEQDMDFCIPVVKVYGTSVVFDD